MLAGELHSLEAALADRYRFERELGRGGWGIVYLANDLKHGRQVAVKVLRIELAGRRTHDRFAREIDIAARLNHPSIVPLYDSGEIDDALYYVMPFVDGETLQQRLKRERQLPIGEALRIAVAVTSALAHAHDAGVVHRDIKPANILLDNPRVLVADFGIARAISGVTTDQWVSSAGTQIGTPEYMSPEQASGDSEIDGRSDIYSLGCVLYEMLAGAPPFTGGPAAAVMARHTFDPVPSLRTVRTTLPLSVEQVVLRALAKVPADRPQSAGELEQALVAAAAPGQAAAGPVRRARPRSRHIGVWSSAATVMLLAAYGGWRLLRPSLPRPRSWVLVADFGAPPDEPSLGTAMRELVKAGLNESRSVNVVPADQLAQARRDASIPDSVPLTAALATEIALRSSVRVIVTGSINRVNANSYALVLSAFDAESKESRYSRTAPASDVGEELVRTIQVQVGQLRQELGDRRRDVDATRPLTRVRTPSFTAFRAYLDAVAYQQAGALDRSNDRLREALTLDTAFASAWGLMAWNYLSARQPDSATRAFTKALAYPDRMSGAERDRLRGDLAYYVDHDPGTAVRAYTSLLNQLPSFAGGHTNRGLYLTALGRYEEAVHELEVAVSIDPLHKGPPQLRLLNLAAELVTIGQLDSARATSRRLQGSAAQYFSLLLLNTGERWDSLAAAAGPIAAAAETERFVRIPATTHEIAAYAAMGQVARASTSLLKKAAVTSGAEARWYLHSLLLLDLALERSTSWQLPPPVRADTGAGAALLRGVYAAARADTLRAMRELQYLNRLDERGQRAVGGGITFLTALLEARRGRWSSAEATLSLAARAGEHDPFSLDRVSSLGLRWLAAESSERAGHLEVAVEMLEKVIAPVAMPPAHYPLRGFVVPYAHRRLAMWYARLGRKDQAAAHWQRFRASLVAPDPSIEGLTRDSAFVGASAARPGSP